MKKYFLILLSGFIMHSLSQAQVICMFCYRQNDSVSDNVHNMILNSGFENTTCNPFPSSDKYCPASSGYNCDIANWTCTGGGTSTYACLFDNTESIIVQGIRAVYMGNYFCNACSTTPDDTSCILHVDCIDQGFPAGYPNNDPTYGGATGVSLQQTVSGLVIGNVYVLEFWCGGEGYFTHRGVFGLDIGFGEMMLPNYPTEASSTEIGTRYLIEFKATSTSHTIKFTNWGHICSTCTEPVLDDVRLYPVADVSSTVPVCDSSLVTNPPPVASDSLFIPNVFTPNGEGTNDFFQTYYSGTQPYYMTIYNRWGEVVFISNDKLLFWDGKVNGNPASDGTYYYTLSVGINKYKGFLTLLR